MDQEPGLHLHEPRAPRRGLAALWRHRAAAVALCASVALHAAFVGGLPSHAQPERPVAATYTARLEPAARVVPPPQATPAAPAPAPPPAKRKPRPRVPPVAPEMWSTLAAVETDVGTFAPAPELPEAAETASGPATAPEAASAPVPSETQPTLTAADASPPAVLALAQPAAAVPSLDPPRFPAEALPAALSIDYQLSSAIADGRATYEWRREGDHYLISGEAEATGFFTLFLEGRVLQESRGTVTTAGLRPERFREKKPHGAEEGLDFDWGAGEVTFDRGTERRTAPMAGNTVDWLSMIFQLAHMPPSAQRLDMEVFTQRKMYRFTLHVLGVEEIDIPLGRVRALHLRHAREGSDEAVDVWLGIDHHHLPVKMRYPVARNRLMVDQVATAVTAR